MSGSAPKDGPGQREDAHVGGAPHDELAAEVRAWEDGTRTPAGWRDAPEAVPRAAESRAVSVRFPTRMLALLKAFAAREGVGYQVLLKRWLDDRIRAEAATLDAAEGPQRTRRPGHRSLRGRYPVDAVLEDVGGDAGPRRRRVG